MTWLHICSIYSTNKVNMYISLRYFSHVFMLSKDESIDPYFCAAAFCQYLVSLLSRFDGQIHSSPLFILPLYLFPIFSLWEGYFISKAIPVKQNKYRLFAHNSLYIKVIIPRHTTHHCSGTVHLSSHKFLKTYFFAFLDAKHLYWQVCCM